MAAVTNSISSKLLCLAAACACAGTAVAGPAAPVVNAGSASYNPATLTLTSTSARTQIAWPSFHVSAGEVVKFVQPSAQSSVLNQVFDPHGLDIQGGLSSNGSVFFLSGGRVSGSGVKLDLVGMISSSLRLPQMALAAGGTTPLAQPGSLATLAEGRIYVISDDAQAVTAASGEVLLNPGKTVELAHAAMLHLRVELTAPRGERINLSRLVAANRDTGIFAGLFRIPAAARAATQGAADAVSIASAQEQGAESAEMQRFLRYALLYAQLRRESPQPEGGMLQVAAAPGSRMLLPELKSRPSPLPRDIALGVPAVHPQLPAVAPASVPVAALAALTAATPEPQPIAPAAPGAAERGNALLFALAPAASAADVSATLEPQPIASATQGETHDATLLALADLAQAAAVVATLEPQPVAVAAPRERGVDHGLLLALAPAAPAAAVVATLEPQPVAQRGAAEPGELRLLARELAAASAPAQPLQFAQLQGDRAQGGHQPQPGNAVVVVALSQPGAAPAAAQAKAKEVLIERHAPRYFTDYRGALFFM